MNWSCSADCRGSREPAQQQLLSLPSLLASDREESRAKVRQSKNIRRNLVKNSLMWLYSSIFGVFSDFPPAPSWLLHTDIPTSWFVNVFQKGVNWLVSAIGSAKKQIMLRLHDPFQKLQILLWLHFQQLLVNSPNKTIFNFSR